MSSLFIFVTLSGCSWLMENPEAIDRRAPRPASSVTRSNQYVPVDNKLDGRTFEGAAAEGVGGGEVPSAPPRPRYQTVVTPTAPTQQAPTQLTNSNGKVIRVGTDVARKSSLRQAYDAAPTQADRDALLLEIRTSEAAGFRQ